MGKGARPQRRGALFSCDGIRGLAERGNAPNSWCSRLPAPPADGPSATIAMSTSAMHGSTENGPTVKLLRSFRTTRSIFGSPPLRSGDPSSSEALIHGMADEPPTTGGYHVLHHRNIRG